MFALSGPAWTALGGIGAAVAAALAVVLAAYINRERKDQDEETTQSVTDFAQAFRERGEIIEGYQADHGALVGMIGELRKDLEHLRRDHAARIKLVEEREQDCLEALEFAHQRIAVLEARNGHA